MGLMDGLSGWLRQIIAVLLLASIVDLLLPNRTMQRYVRLVAGLFVLLTVATPVLNWIKGDFGSKLADGLVSVERSPRGAPEQLAMIEAEGAKLRDKQAVRAANLVSTKLAAAIREDVEANEGRKVSGVDVRTAKDDGGGWKVTGVTIVLEASAAADPETSKPAGDIARVKGIEPIPDIDIRVGVGVGSDAGEDGGESEEAVEAMAQGAAIDPKTESRVVSLVSAKFGIAPGAIEVTEAAAARGSGGANGARR